MRRFAFLFVFLGLITPAFAEDAVFRDYASMRSQLDALMRDRAIKDYMLAVGAADEMTVEQLNNLENRVKSVYPQPLTNADVLLVQEMGGGFRQELLAYWTGTSYIFVRMLLQQLPNELVAVQTTFNSSFDEVHKFF